MKCPICRLVAWCYQPVKTYLCKRKLREANEALALGIQVLDVGGRLVSTGRTEHLRTNSIIRSRPNLTSTSPRQISGQHAEEIALWSHVLRLGIMDGLASSVTRNKLEQDREQDLALLWIQSGEDGLGSFTWVCQLLGLSSAAVREAVMGELRRTKADKAEGMGHRIRYWTRN